MNFLAVALIIGGITVAVGLLCYAGENLRHHKHAAPQESAEAPQQEAGKSEPEVCCGLHAVCEKIYPKNPDMKPDYYDDEELDRLAGKDPDTFTDDEIEEIRDVMLTLRPDDVAGWGKSIEMRGIRLPQALRDELLLLIQNP